MKKVIITDQSGCQKRDFCRGRSIYSIRKYGLYVEGETVELRFRDEFGPTLVPVRATVVSARPRDEWDETQGRVRVEFRMEDGE